MPLRARNRINAIKWKSPTVARTTTHHTLEWFKRIKKIVSFKLTTWKILTLKYWANQRPPMFSIQKSSPSSGLIIVNFMCTLKGLFEKHLHTYVCNDAALSKWEHDSKIILQRLFGAPSSRSDVRERALIYSIIGENLVGSRVGPICSQVELKIAAAVAPKVTIFSRAKSVKLATESFFHFCT